MNSSIHCGLQGQYKVDIFSGKTLVNTTDWFSNNITNTGMLYPYTYPFARCFMFLSLGSGTMNTPLSGYSSISSAGGTPIMNFRSNSVSNPQTGQYIGYGAYSTGVPSACGTLFTPYGIDMFRGWRIPSGDSDTLKDSLDIGCFMVSPSSGTDDIGKYAFSLVNQMVHIPSGFNATIYYKLSLRFPEYSGLWTGFRGTTSSSCGYFDTGSASFPDGVGGVDYQLVSGWKNLSGIYRQIFPGLQFVDNNGGCVTTKYGSEMEPSADNCRNLYFYLSPDIAQFSTSIYGTGSATTDSAESGAYNSCGLAANYSEFINYVRKKTPQADTYLSVIDNVVISDPNAFYYSGDSLDESSFGKTKDPSDTTTVQLNFFPAEPFETVPINHHLTNVKNVSGYTTSIPNFKYNSRSFVDVTSNPVNSATPGSGGWSNYWPNYGQPAVFSTSLKRMPISTPVSRSQGVTKFARIAPIQAFGYNARYGSMTLAFMEGGITDINNLTAHPYMEYLFFDTSGRAANCPHYRIIPEIYLSERGSGVAGVVFSITGSGIDGGTRSPVQRIWNATGFMGPYNASNESGINPNYAWTGYIAGSSDLTSGILWSGTNVPSTNTIGIATGGASGAYGVGAVYGMVTSSTGFYGKPYDVCLLDNPVWSGFSGQNGNGFGSAPISTGEARLLCWPYPESKIGLAITGMRYYSSGWSGNGFNDTFDTIGTGNGAQYVSHITGSAGYTNGTHTFGNGISVTIGGSPSRITSSSTGTPNVISAAANATSGCIPTQWKKPSGNIHHLEFFSGSGYRLLPNYGSGNIGFNDADMNTYQPIRGGQFPGLSMENGMELYFDFRWSA